MGLDLYGPHNPAIFLNLTVELKDWAVADLRIC